MEDTPAAAREDHCWIAVDVERAQSSIAPSRISWAHRKHGPRTVWMEPGVTVVTCQDIGDSDTAISVIVTSTLGIVYAVVSLYVAYSKKVEN